MGRGELVRRLVVRRGCGFRGFLDWFDEERGFGFIYLFSLDTVIFDYEIFVVIGVGRSGFRRKFIASSSFSVVRDE